jgi:ADP-ribosylglycohydrolase
VMDKKRERYYNAVYAGVLGKIIGVYLGRPVEGWSYPKIRSRFGEVTNYVHRETHLPLIVADDDISGTFVFFNAMEDRPDPENVSAADFGRAWLDYLIEDKTILWWGGLGRSTEHTAYLRLKNGYKPPYSGSMSLNGKGVSEQIGAQIFIDAIAMTCPGDPQKAMELVGKAASVSHDGIALDSARFIAAAEAMAFEGGSVEDILDRAIRMNSNETLRAIYDDVRGQCVKMKDDWRAVRDWLDERYGYQLYPGNCHVVPNFTLIVASLLLGGDSFARAIEIAVSGGWDTDCNAANIGCFNGIRLGIDAITRETDFRGPVADRLYTVSSDGGRCVSDAVLQTRRIVEVHSRMQKAAVAERMPRFAFEVPGSVQGFEACPSQGENSDISIGNANQGNQGNGLSISFDPRGAGRTVFVSTPTLWDRRDRQQNYNLMGSPTLYSGQTVRMNLENPGTLSLEARPYILHYDIDNRFIMVQGASVRLQGGESLITDWVVPDTDGMPIARIGFEVIGSGSGSEELILRHMGWNGAPSLRLRGPYRNNDIAEPAMVIQAWTASARQFSFDSRVACCVSHTEKGGTATLGTEEWTDYKTSAVVSLSIHEAGGIAARCRGHRRYYAALLRGGDTFQLVRRDGDEETVLAEAPFEYQCDDKHTLELVCQGTIISCTVDGGSRLESRDAVHLSGGAGFVIDTGTMMADDFCVAPA